VLCAGTIESAKIALQSDLADPAGLVGKGITDHPIWFTHFSLPAGSPWAANQVSAQVWSRHRDTSVDRHHSYNVVVEFGADFNQGRYVDADNLRRHREAKGDATLGEVVFLFNAPLVEGNRLELYGPPHLPAPPRSRPAGSAGTRAGRPRPARGRLRGRGGAAVRPPAVGVDRQFRQSPSHVRAYPQVPAAVSVAARRSVGGGAGVSTSATALGSTGTHT
jgi:hypothetical protein